MAEVEKKRKNNKAQQTMYFYREYGGKEVDLVLEDYKKQFICVEVKLSQKKSAKNVFPLACKSMVINGQNYFEKIDKLF